MSAHPSGEAIAGPPRVSCASYSEYEIVGAGSLVLMVAFGAGFTWAANVVRL